MEDGSRSAPESGVSPNDTSNLNSIQIRWISGTDPLLLSYMEHRPYIVGRIGTDLPPSFRKHG
jgi:hypothetical protein